jgi:PKD repeat protein
MSIRELYRQKLEGAEIIPDTEVSAKLMRKLARREFLRFNPARFNVYYIGGILVAAITASLVLLSGSENAGKKETLTPFIEISKPLKNETIKAPSEPSVVLEANKLNVSPSGSTGNKLDSHSKANKVNVSDIKRNLQDTNKLVPSGINESLSKKGLFAELSTANNMLQNKSEHSDIFFESSSSEGCVPMKIQFSNKVTDIDSCRWIFGDGGSSDKRNPEWIFDVEGEYKVVLTVFRISGTIETSSSIIKVHPKPLARFEISPEEAILPDDVIHFLNYSTNAVKFKWNFGDGIHSELFEPQHQYSKYGNYNVGLIVTSEYGCSDSMYVINAFSGSQYFINFPNAFIPNSEGPSGGFYSSKSDEAAQVFHPVFSGVSDYQLRIFSKLGVLIFESSDINLGWDGYFKGQLSNPGVYIWKVRGNFRNGEPFTKMGDLTLLRK